MIRWKLILEEFGSTIQHISVADNILADMLSLLLSTTVNRGGTITINALIQEKELF